MNSGKVYNTLKYKLNNDIIKIIQRYNIINVKRQYNLVKYNIIVNFQIGLSKKIHKCHFYYCFICDKLDWDYPNYIYSCSQNKIMRLYDKNFKRMCNLCVGFFYDKVDVIREIKQRKLIL
jgi:hypothetical protein